MNFPIFPPLNPPIWNPPIINPGIIVGPGISGEVGGGSVIVPSITPGIPGFPGNPGGPVTYGP